MAPFTSPVQTVLMVGVDSFVFSDLTVYCFLPIMTLCGTDAREHA